MQVRKRIEWDLGEKMEFPLVKRKTTVSEREGKGKG